MQEITYLTHIPKIGERVVITIKDPSGVTPLPGRFVVTVLENDVPPYDSVLIENVITKKHTRLVITNGRWQVEYYDKPHDVEFLKMDNVRDNMSMSPKRTRRSPGLSRVISGQSGTERIVPLGSPGLLRTQTPALPRLEPVNSQAIPTPERVNLVESPNEQIVLSPKLEHVSPVLSPRLTNEQIVMSPTIPPRSPNEQIVVPKTERIGLVTSPIIPPRSSFSDELLRLSKKGPSMSPKPSFRTLSPTTRSVLPPSFSPAPSLSQDVEEAALLLQPPESYSFEDNTTSNELLDGVEVPMLEPEFNNDTSLSLAAEEVPEKEKEELDFYSFTDNSIVEPEFYSFTDNSVEDSAIINVPLPGLMGNTFSDTNGDDLFEEASDDAIDAVITPQTNKDMGYVDYDNPMNIIEGTVGWYNPRFGDPVRFYVKKIVAPGRKVEVMFDRPVGGKIQHLLEYRRDLVWRLHGQSKTAYEPTITWESKQIK